MRSSPYSVVWTMNEPFASLLACPCASSVPRHLPCDKNWWGTKVDARAWFVERARILQVDQVTKKSSVLIQVDFLDSTCILFDM